MSMIECSTLLDRLRELAAVEQNELDNPAWDDRQSLCHRIEPELREMWSYLSVESKLVIYICTSRLQDVIDDARDLSFDLDRFL